MRRRLYPVFAFSLTTMFVSCGSTVKTTEVTDGQPNGLFLGADSFNVENSEVVSDYDVISALENEKFITAESIRSSSSSDTGASSYLSANDFADFEECMHKALRNSLFVVPQADTVQVKANIDMTECANIQSEDSTQFNEYSVKMYYEMKCAGADYWNLDGYTLDDKDQIQRVEKRNGPIALCPRFEWSRQTSTVYDIEYSNTGDKTHFRRVENEAEGKTINSPCVHTYVDGRVTYDGSCQKIMVSKVTSAEYNGEALPESQLTALRTRLELDDASYLARTYDSWFDTGRVQGEYANWNVELRYKKNGQLPSFQLSTQSAQRNGRLNRKDNYGLQSSFSEVVKPKFLNPKNL